MTDRHAAYIVVLVRDVRTDDAEAIITALRMVRGVVDVQPVLAEHGQQVARSRLGWELRGKVVDAVGGVFDEAGL